MDNVLNNIGDVLVIKLKSKISGKIHLQSYTDSLEGLTDDRTVESEFRISQDGIFWSDWTTLTNDNLSKGVYITDNSLLIEIRYIRSGKDVSGSVTFKDITFNGQREEIKFDAPTLLSSILNKAVGTDELNLLEQNIFKKLYYRGIIPEYIERAANSDYKEDKDFVDLFFSVARFYSLFIIYFRRWENFKNDLDLLREQVRGYGIYFNEGDITLEELQYLAENIFSQAQQRGTQNIFTRKGDVMSNGEIARIDGEFIRLTRNEAGDELLYENIPNWKVGWVMGQCSPMYKGTSYAYNLNKTKENTKDFQDLNNFVYFEDGKTSCSLSELDDRKCFLISASGKGQAGLGRFKDEDVSDNLYTADPQMDYEITFAFQFDSPSSLIHLTFGVEGFDINKNYLNDAFVTPNGFNVENVFLQESLSHWSEEQWYYARGIIHAYGSKNIDSESTNLGFGTNLYFNNSFVRYILPKIQIQSELGDIKFAVWDYKIRPLIRGKNITPLKDGTQEAKSLGFIQSPNMFYTYFRNNNKNQSRQEIIDIIEKHLYPFNKTDIFTITGK